jgi:hypothetical protein
LFRVAAGRLAHVFEHGRQVAQVQVLAVAVVQAAEQAEDFQVALQGREFEIAVEGVDVGIHRQAQRLARCQ